MNRIASFALLAGLLAALVPGSAEAEPITYTETGTLSGTIGNTPFTNATVTFTVVADTANITTGTSQGFPIYENAGATTVQIAGIGTASLIDISYGAFSEDFSSALSGVGLVGIRDISEDHDVLGNITNIPTYYDLTSSYTATGSPDTSVAAVLTDMGELIFTSRSGDATFTATPSAVPEPSSLAMCGLAGLIGSAYAWRRRKRSA